MKKSLYIAAVAATSLSFANVANADKNTGCGLGTMLFDGNKGIAPNVLAVTTNGTSGNQTFGITSGTLGCDPNSEVDSAAGKLFAFADDNLNELAADFAKGNGEYLASAASIIGIDNESDKAHFFKIVQKNFSDIFPNKNINTQDFVSSISDLIKEDKLLKAYQI